MRDVEQVLSVLLVERAERVAPRSGHREDTLRRARRRRVTNAVAAGMASVAVVAAGVGIVRSADSPPPVRPAAPATPGHTIATAGEYGFWSKTGPEFPWIAKGYFRDREWELRASPFNLEDRLTRLVLQIHEKRGELGGTGMSTGFEDLEGGFAVNHHDLGFVFDHEVAVVFGAVVPETRTVEVVMDGGGERIRAHVYEGYDARTGQRVDYWVAFVPAELEGRVVALDPGGREVGNARFTPMR